MATAIRTIGHEDRLSLVEHLEELRTRLIVSGIVLAVVFGLCLWQNHALLHVVNRPLEHVRHGQLVQGVGPAGQTGLAQQTVRRVARDTEAIVGALAAPNSHLPAELRAQLAAELPRLRADTARLPASPSSEKLTTLGIGEPFTTTLTVVFFFAVILALPVILYELYGFVMPALQPSERRAVEPLLASIPLLFATGVAFGYFVVLPAALHFLVNFNSSQFNILVQAGPYYQFAATMLLAMGLIFQVPVAILGAVRVGLVTPAQLRRGRRYAIVACAAVAAFLPGDAVTLILETVPLYLLYEVSILVASFVARRDATRAAQAVHGSGGEDPPTSPGGLTGGGGPPFPGPAGGAQTNANRDNVFTTTSDPDPDPSVTAIIDHIDPSLSGYDPELSGSGAGHPSDLGLPASGPPPGTSSGGNG